METDAGMEASHAQAQEREIFVTVSDALEYLFCPRFIFFERCLMIPEHQEKRYKVLKEGSCTKFARRLTGIMLERS